MISKNPEKSNQAIIPERVVSETQINLEDQKVFSPNRISKSELQDYLNFCKLVYPTGENQFGVLLNKPLNKSKALNFLHENDYDLVKTKFYLAFPIVHHYTKIKNIEIDHDKVEMIKMIEKFKIQKMNRKKYKEYSSNYHSVLTELENDVGKVEIKKLKKLLHNLQK